MKQSFFRAIRGFRSLLNPPEPPLQVNAGLNEIIRASGGLEEPAKYDQEEPLFLLATGWRTGSTLMQRILTTDPEILLWGEPHGDLDIINRLGDIVAGFCRPLAPESVIYNDKNERLWDQWIANLFPKTGAIRNALQAMVYEWLGQPAKDLGYSRWGMKEVRLGYEDAVFLRWLFPKARFVVITRDPYSACRSTLQLGAVWERWPDRLVNDPFSYGRIWNRLALSWEQVSMDFPVKLYRLEDITSGQVNFDELSEHSGLNIKPEFAINEKVGVGHSGVKLNYIDKWLINNSTKTARSWLGYK